ncbi:MAG: uroporphyrinogen-III synthase [Chloroflexi bacterium]|nr:uroporphyrinogen-III synthase [Chloroflexota bacterium]
MADNHTPDARSLDGYSVLVTRPEEQARSLIAAISARGGQAIFAPMIVINGREGDPVPQSLVRRLPDYQIVIFLSRNAADFGVRLIAAERQTLTHCQVYAVGAGSAAQLATLGVNKVIMPRSDFTSEGLLKLPGLQAAEVNGKRVLIVRGVGGRELLGQKLQQRGASVDFCEVYTRTPPTTPLTGVLRACKVTQPDIGLITSLESLSNLAAQIDAEKLDRLYDVPLLVAGARTALEVERLGFTEPPIVVDNPGDASLVEALERWVQDGR